MKDKFLIERDGVKYQGRLPREVMKQYELAQFCYNQLGIEEDKNTIEVIEVRNNLASKILPYCNVVNDDGELLVHGEEKKGFTLAHLMVLVEIYQQELILPLLA